MSWRTVQLGNNLCDQDKLIIDLFKGKSVRYIGDDAEFAQNLVIDPNSHSVIIIINYNIWLSELIEKLKQIMTDNITEEFYIGINRYFINGNDTTRTFNSPGSQCLIDYVAEQLNTLNFCITKSGFLDDDLGRYFNFVQPLTWIYGTNKNN